MHKEIIIIGAGASGVGMGIMLKKMQLDFLIVEKERVAESFRRWPSGTRLISPSFTGNFFGSPDLNALSPDTSPGYLLGTEHPTGNQYAMYVQKLAEFYELPIQEKTQVTSLKKSKSVFYLTTNQGEYTADVVIWAGGEYQFPKTDVCHGSNLAVHNTAIPSWDELDGDRFAIVGGYESGFDTAIQLAKLKKKSVIFDSADNLGDTRSDSSFSLSLYTKDRYRQYKEYITIKPHARIDSIQKDKEKYTLTTVGGKTFQFDTQPILATGFETSLTHVKDFFHWKDGNVELSAQDESTKVKNFFLIGPQVKHAHVIFCFIYKFRQRFAVVAKAAATNLDTQDDPFVQKVLTEYRQKNFYLDDLSCCGNECAC